MDCPSTPGAPLLSLTCSQAHQTSCPPTANGLPSSGPPDTGLRPPSGLSSSMTLLPAVLVDETNKATSKPAPSLPAPPRQAGGSALLRAGPTASPATVSAPHATRRLRASLSPPPRGSHIRAGPPPFHADAAYQARATSTPGTTWPAIRATARPIPETLALPGSDATLTCNDASTVNAATGNHRHGRFQRNAFLVPA